MKKLLIVLVMLFFSTYGLKAQLFCPDDITVSCLSDLSTDECGLATVVSGNYHPSMVKFIDQNETNACNEGIVYRRFYLDTDYSNTYTENEPSCVQTITMEYFNLPLNIQFPSDKEYTCLDEIPVDSPTWLYNPCDLVGYTYEDEIFEFEEGACLKIVRTYHVINWCVYDVDASAGIYEGIQVIKIVDNIAPDFEECDDQYFDTDGNCEAYVTLTNSATDGGDCPSGVLDWRASVDLWADGTEDLVYGPNQAQPFRLDPVASGGQVEIVIPEALGVSKHKVTWKVTDGCGNVRSCSNDFFVEDNKPPSPYCINFTGTTLNGADGGTLTIPVSFFSLDALDNCTEKGDIILSFSENLEDTERVLECGDAGLQFFRIYYTDEAGNQDFCEVFMFVFDNGSCSMKYAPEGKVIKPDGTPISGAKAYLMEDQEIVALKNSNEAGYFNFGEQDLMEVYVATVKKEDGDMAKVDIEDFFLMRSALLGLSNLDFYQKMAADIDQSDRFDIDDLYAFRDVLLGKSEIVEEDKWTFIPQMLNLSNNQEDLGVSQSIPYTSYGKGFDFYGVQTGDLTGSARSQTIEEETIEEVSLILSLLPEGVSVKANQDIRTDAFQIDWKGSAFTTYNDRTDASLIEIGEGQRYTNLRIGQSFASGQEMFYAPFAEGFTPVADDIVRSAKVFLKNASQSVKINWIIEDRRNEIDPEVVFSEIKVFPIPMKDELTIAMNDIAKIEMFDLTGSRISLIRNIDDQGARISTQDELPSGIYILRVLANDEEHMIKVVK